MILFAHICTFSCVFIQPAPPFKKKNFSEKTDSACFSLTYEYMEIFEKLQYKDTVHTISTYLLLIKFSCNSILKVKVKYHAF
jgi:hypothetical protein